MKKLFQNYSYEFVKNEAKIITSFCNQAIEQMEGDKNFFGDVKAFNSIIEKLSQDPSNVKLTKDEAPINHSPTIGSQNNLNFLAGDTVRITFTTSDVDNNQYVDLLEKHFND